MMRRDYVLRMIEEFIAGLRKLQGMKDHRRWDEADDALDAEFKRLVGTGAQAVAQLSETELLAKLLQGEATLFVRDKTLLLATLLNEAGDIAVAQGRAEEGHACYLKGLHLLLDIFARDEVSECPEFVPRVEVFVTALEGAALPRRTLAMLMQHYERTGQFARAEDMLFAMLDEGNDPGVVEFGIAFCERLRDQSDEALENGHLPRVELEAGLAELRERRATNVK